MKELQRTIAFKAYNTVLNSGNSKIGKWLHAQIHELYFGNENDTDSIGYADQLLKGLGPFAPIVSP